MFQIEFSNKGIKEAHCDCVRGQVSCHHMAAVLLHAFRNVSITDRSCVWSERNKGGHVDKDVNIPMDAFRKRKKKPEGKNVNKKKSKNEETEVYRATFPCHLTDEEKEHLVKEIQKCKGAAQHFAWLLSKEPPPENEIEEDSQDDNNENKVQLIINTPKDIILTEDFAKAACKETYLTSQLGLNWDVIQDIAEATKGQRANPFWFVLREWRITASKFGDVLRTYTKRNGPTPCKSLLESLYKPKDLSKAKTVQWGIIHENYVIDKYKKKYPVEPTGVWLHGSGVLGGSPDGLIGKKLP